MKLLLLILCVLINTLTAASPLATTSPTSPLLTKRYDIVCETDIPPNLLASVPAINSGIAYLQKVGGNCIIDPVWGSRVSCERLSAIWVSSKTGKELAVPCIELANHAYRIVSRCCSDDSAPWPIWKWCHDFEQGPSIKGSIETDTYKVDVQGDRCERGRL